MSTPVPGGPDQTSETARARRCAPGGPRGSPQPEEEEEEEEEEMERQTKPLGSGPVSKVPEVASLTAQSAKSEGQQADVRCSMLHFGRMSQCCLRLPGLAEDLRGKAPHTTNT